MNELSRKYGTYEKQEELLRMIKDVDTLLSDFGVEYSLCGGSLLGAVREDGFIPWDDDIDIMLDRENYTRLVNLFSNHHTGQKYTMRRNLWIDRIQRSDDNRTGIAASTIDIFVMDNCPDNVVFRKVKILAIQILQGMMKEKIDYKEYSLPYRVCLWLTHIIGLPFSADRKFSWYQTVSQLGNSKKTRYMTGYNDLFKLLSLRYTSHLFEKIICHTFEDTLLPITAEYDSYLKTQYGDYMTPPNEEDRVPLHLYSDR